MNGARYSYLRQICQQVEQGKDIVIVSEDYAAPIFDDFRRKYSKRFLSVGIAEQNGVSVACGLSLAGKYPIVYGCAPFPLTRAIDQIKSAVAGMHLPMTILNSGIGFGVPEFGATHYNADDIAIVRSIPGIKIVTPSDNIMAQKFADYSTESEYSFYLRMDKNSEGELYQGEEINFERGFNVVWKAGEKADIAIVSCGFTLHEMIELAQKWKKDGLYAKVIDLYSLPFNISDFLDTVGSLPIISVEEHIIQGGIGSIVLETINTYQKTNSVIQFGIDFKDSYPSMSGSREYFMQKYGLTSESITLAIKNICKKQGINKI